MLNCHGSTDYSVFFRVTVALFHSHFRGFTPPLLRICLYCKVFYVVVLRSARLPPFLGDDTPTTSHMFILQSILCSRAS